MSASGRFARLLLPGLVCSCAVLAAEKQTVKATPECGARQSMCAELARIASLAGSYRERAKAVQRLVDKYRAAEDPACDVRAWQHAEPVRTSVVLEVPHGSGSTISVWEAKQRDLARGLLPGWLRDIGLNPTDDDGQQRATIEVVAVIGSLSSTYSMDGHRVDIASGAHWTGFLTVRMGERCALVLRFANHVEPASSVEGWSSERAGAAAVEERAGPAFDESVANAVMRLAERLYDDETLAALTARVAKSGGSPAMRKRAVASGRLTDQILLGAIARTDHSSEVRKQAVRKVSDQALLAEIAQSDVDVQVRVTAVRKLGDQAALRKVIETDANSWVRQEAVERLSDQAVLREIARLHSDPEVRAKAGRVLLIFGLVKVAKTHPDPKTRLGAVIALDRIGTCWKELTDLARTAPDPGVRRKAVELLLSQTDVADVARTDPDPGVRKSAQKRLSLLRRIR